MDNYRDEDKVDSMTRIMFTNLLLLGMDVEDMVDVYKIPFNKDMFNQYNKVGSEAVLHFLFHNLNPTLCDEQFRDCWPLFDKRSEMHFRKTCINWMSSIKKNEPDEHWPVLNASSLQFPGRSKFIRILYTFSMHVLKQVMKPDLEHQHSLVCPLLSLHTSDMAGMMASSIQDNTSLELKRYINAMYVTHSSHQMWKTYADDLVKNCRGVSKHQREIEQEKRPSISVLVESAVKQGCALPVKRTLNMFDGDKDVTNTKRMQRLQKVKELWEKVTALSKELERGHEIVKSVLEHSSSKERLEATDIGIRIPGLLLKQCEKEIRQQKIDNVFVGGRLNLLSVLQLWNLCLHLYIEQLEAENIPDVSKEIPGLTMQAHKFHSFLMEIQSLRKEMSTSFIPELENTIQIHRAKVNAQIEEATSHSHNKSSLGLQLTTPTLPMSAYGKPQARGDTPAGPLTAATKVRKDTPNIVSEMINSIATATQKNQSMRPSQLAHLLEHVKTTQRSSPVSTTPRTSQTSLNGSRNTRHTLPGKEGTLSKVTRPSSKQNGKNLPRPSNDTKHAPIGRKDISGDGRLVKSKTVNKSFSEKESTSSYQSALDQLAHSVANSVMNETDHEQPMRSGHSFYDDILMNVNQNNAVCFSQTLISEQERNESVSHKFAKSPRTDGDSLSSNVQKYNFNGARPKEKTESLKTQNSHKSTRLKMKSRSPTDDEERISPRTRTAETSTLPDDVSPSSCVNRSSQSFLNRFHVDMSQALSPFNDNSRRESGKESQVRRNEKHFLDTSSPTMVTDGLHSNSSLVNYLDSLSVSGVTSLHDLLISSPVNDKSQRHVREKVSSNGRSKSWKEVLDGSGKDSANVLTNSAIGDVLTDRGFGDGQASEHIQTVVQNLMFDTDEDENDDSDENEQTFTHVSQLENHLSDSDQPSAQDEILTKTSFIPNETEDRIFLRTVDRAGKEGLSISIFHEFEGGDLLGGAGTQAFDIDEREDPMEDNTNHNDSFAPLKHGILLDNKSPDKTGHLSPMKESTDNSPVEEPKAQSSGISEAKAGLISASDNWDIQTQVASLFAQSSKLFDDIDDD